MPGRIAAVLLALALFASLALQAADPKFPVLSGRVVDEAGLLKPEDKRALETELAALEARSSDQLVVVTVKSLQGFEIADYGYRLGRAWGIGQAGAKNNGVLLIIAPSERQVRIEVGRGLEPVLTDALSRLIIENRILPAIRRGETSAGILAGARDIRDALQGDAEEVKRRAQGYRRPVNQPPSNSGIPIELLIWIAIVVFLLIQAARNRQPPGRPGQRRSADRGGWIIVTTPGSSNRWPSDRGGWSNDDGFKGGGGDFGGGGASGRW